MRNSRTIKLDTLLKKHNEFSKLGKSLPVQSVEPDGLSMLKKGATARTWKKRCYEGQRVAASLRITLAKSGVARETCGATLALSHPPGKNVAFVAATRTCQAGGDTSSLYDFRIRMQKS
jgi:hypothetical protein